MVSLLNTTTGYDLDLGLAGAVASGSIAEGDTFVNAGTSGGVDSAGALDFGVIAARGTGAMDAVPFVFGPTSAQRVAGLTRRPAAPMSATAPANIIGIPVGKEFTIARMGDYIVYAAENAAADDEVVAVADYTVATGVTTNVGAASNGVANGTTRKECRGIKWKTTTTRGQKGIVSVYHRDAGVNLGS